MSSTVPLQNRNNYSLKAETHYTSLDASGAAAADARSTKLRSIVGVKMGAYTCVVRNAPQNVGYKRQTQRVCCEKQGALKLRAAANAVASRDSCVNLIRAQSLGVAGTISRFSIVGERAGTSAGNFSRKQLHFVASTKSESACMLGRRFVSCKLLATQRLDGSC